MYVGLVPSVSALVQAETAAADDLVVTVPGPCDVVQFGAIVGELYVANATADVRSLEIRDSDGGNASEKATITLGLTGGAFPTPAVGTVVWADNTVFPLHVAAGKQVALKHKTAKGSAAGAAYTFALIRYKGYINLTANKATV